MRPCAARACGWCVCAGLCVCVRVWGTVDAGPCSCGSPRNACRPLLLTAPTTGSPKLNGTTSARPRLGRGTWLVAAHCGWFLLSTAPLRACRCAAPAAAARSLAVRCVGRARVRVSRGWGRRVCDHCGGIGCAGMRRVAACAPTRPRTVVWHRPVTLSSPLPSSPLPPPPLLPPLTRSLTALCPRPWLSGQITRWRSGDEPSSCTPSSGV